MIGRYMAGNASFDQITSGIISSTMRTQAGLRVRGVQFKYGVPELWGLTARNPVLGYAPVTRVV